jgi:hypothetical protein
MSASADASAAAAQGAPAEERKDLWQALLNRAAKHKRGDVNASLVVVGASSGGEQRTAARHTRAGDPQSGKTNLLAQLSDRVSERAPVGSGDYLLDYSFVNVKNADDDADGEWRRDRRPAPLRLVT